MLSSELATMNINRTRFDPSNNEHRKIAAQYFQTRSWGHTDVRFVVEYPFTNVVTMVTTKLAAYYASVEFPEFVGDDGNQPEETVEDVPHNFSKSAPTVYEYRGVIL